MNDIQKARDLLAKWREATTKPFSNPYPWSIEHEQPGRAGWSDVLVDSEGDWIFDYTDDDELGLVHKGSADPDIVRLIVGTAGNPDLLDAIDGMLERAAGQYERGYQGGWNDEMARLAAAIIAADERMQQ